MRFIIFLSFALFLSCSSNQPKPAEKADKHYSLTGKVVSINAKDQTAAIDGAAIPGFMEAMTMDYPIASKAEFAQLHPGDKIAATVDLAADGSYSLSHIQPQPASTK